MPRTRLLVLASTFPAKAGDGTPEFVSDLAGEVAKEFDAAVVVPAVPGASSSEARNGFRVRRFRYFPRPWEDLADGAIIENLRQRKSRWLQVVPFMISEALAARRAVRKGQPAAIHAHWIIPQGVVARLVAPGRPLLITTLGGDLYALNAAPLRALKRWVLRGASYVTVMNEEMAEQVRGLGMPADRVEVVPMGADLDTVRPRVERNDGVLSIVFVGRMVEKKGLTHLLRAVRMLEPGTWRLRVIGDGPLRAELEAEAGPDVEFLGKQGRETLREEYAKADVAVFPSVPSSSGDQDGLPVALLEAMGAGCAIIASDLPGISEAVIPGETGALVEPGKPEAIATALEELAGNPELRARLGSSAAERAQNVYGKAAIGRRYTDILHRIIASQE